MREGAWVGRAPAGSGSGRHVEEGGCRRLERRGVPLCFAADSPSSEPARGDEPRPVSLVPLAAQRLSPPPAPARPTARPPSGLAPSQARERSPASTSYLSSPGCSLAPSPAAPSPGRLTAHGALGCSPPPPRVPAPPRLPPPCLTRALWRGRARVSGTDGAATAPAVAAPPLRRARVAAPPLRPRPAHPVRSRPASQPTPFPRPRRAVWCV